MLVIREAQMDAFRDASLERFARALFASLSRGDGHDDGRMSLLRVAVRTAPTAGIFFADETARYAELVLRLGADPLAAGGALETLLNDPDLSTPEKLDALERALGA